MSIPDRASRRAPRGMTLIEMIFFMVIVGIALGGIVGVLSTALRGGADMVSQKQAVAIAEALVEEIALKPFTRCDPDDPAAGDPTASCSQTEADGPETGETTRANFDNVNDYSGYSFTSPVTDASGQYAFPSGFSATVSVAHEALNGVPADQSLRVTVVVTGPGNSSATIETYRTRYAPNFAN